MNSVSAEIAQEIRVLFQFQYIHTHSGKKKTQHHAGGPSSSDATACVNRFAHRRQITHSSRNVLVTRSLRLPGVVSRQFASYLGGCRPLRGCHPEWPSG